MTEEWAKIKMEMFLKSDIYNFNAGKKYGKFILQQYLSFLKCYKMLKWFKKGLSVNITLALRAIYKCIKD